MTLKRVIYPLTAFYQIRFYGAGTLISHGVAGSFRIAMDHYGWLKRPACTGLNWRKAK